jgi:hypothetical protein
MTLADCGNADLVVPEQHLPIAGRRGNLRGGPMDPSGERIDEEEQPWLSR